MNHVYEEADRVIIFNENDEDLQPIVYKLPSPPPPEQIEGYGLAPEKQMWRHKPMSQKLKELHDRTDMQASQKIKFLEQHQAYYEDDIEYIRLEWERRMNGHWFYIKGKPYYITGDNYFYLQWWPIEGNPVQFRMRDRKWWLFVEMCDKDRNSYGFNYPKHRREGATTRVSCKRYLVATSSAFSRVGLQSKDRMHAEEVHRTMILDQFKYQIPFWFKPIWDGDNQNQSTIRFYAPDSKIHQDYGKKALQSIIDYRDSGVKAYDGLKLKFLHGDETGKTTEVNVKTRWEIQRQCLSQGSTIIGKCINTSTVDEMDKGGGKIFRQLCDQSHYHQRTENRRTVSGLYNLFMPAWEGFEGEDHTGEPFIDKYGFDRVDSDNLALAYKYHTAQVDGYRRLGDMEGLIEYTRQFPLKWKDCWKQSAKDCNFNLSIIEERLDHYRNGNPDVQRGNFLWLNGNQDTEVIWVSDPNGRFILSYQFPNFADANKCYYEDGHKFPGNVTRFIAGGDPFKFKTTRNSKKSLGAGAVFMHFDSNVDATKDIAEWKSHRFVCTYNFRPKDKQTYGEDMIMMCHYFGCQMFPEINVDFLWEYFETRGYVHYLMFPIDSYTGKVSRTPGAQTGEKLREEIFREWQYYIEKHGRRERHTELLEQCKEIEDDMGDYDLFVAGGLALVAAKKSSVVAKDTPAEDFADLFPTYTYNL
jgi:hypothetical protein